MYLPAPCSLLPAPCYLQVLLRGGSQRLLPGEKLELLKDCHCFALMSSGVKKVEVLLPSLVLMSSGVKKVDVLLPQSPSIQEEAIPADDGSGRLLEPAHSGVRSNWATGLRVDIRYG